MKRFILGLGLLLLLLPLSAQTSLDSIKVFTYQEGQEIPSIRQLFQNDLWGKNVQSTTELYDDFENSWYYLNLNDKIYNTDELIEILSYYRDGNAWVPGWRYIFTYPSENERLKQFYLIDGEVDTKGWEVSQQMINNHRVSVSAKFVEETSGELVERFRSRLVNQTNGYEIVNSRLHNGAWEDYYKVKYILDNGVIVENTQESYQNNVWVNTSKVIFNYDTKGLLTSQDAYNWEGTEWNTEARSKEFFYYNQIQINPPEIDEQNLIVVKTVNDELYVTSKLDLSYISIYDMNSRLIYRNNNPRKVEIILTDMRGEYLVEVVSLDDRKKIEQVLFN